MVETPIPAHTRWQFQTAMILAMSADALQLFVTPLFAEGALSPADDVLDEEDVGPAGRLAQQVRFVFGGGTEKSRNEGGAPQAALLRPVAPEPSVNPRATHANESCLTFVLSMYLSAL